MGSGAVGPHARTMENDIKKASIKTRASFAVLVGAITACAGVATPGPAHANPGTACAAQDPTVALSVVDVRKLYTRGERHMHNQPMGAAIKVVPTAGMTIADLQRTAECYAGQSGLTGESSPLAVEGVEVRVDRDGSAYVLHLTSDSRSGALEIQRRAEAAAQR
jgi:hypothetical protein